MKSGSVFCGCYCVADGGGRWCKTAAAQRLSSDNYQQLNASTRVSDASNKVKVTQDNVNAVIHNCNVKAIATSGSIKTVAHNAIKPASNSNIEAYDNINVRVTDHDNVKIKSEGRGRTAERRLCRHCIAKHRQTTISGGDDSNTSGSKTGDMLPTGRHTQDQGHTVPAVGVTAASLTVYEQSMVHFYDAISFARRRHVTTEEVVVDTWPGDQDLMLVAHDGGIRMALAQDDDNGISDDVTSGGGTLKASDDTADNQQRHQQEQLQRFSHTALAQRPFVSVPPYNHVRGGDNRHLPPKLHIPTAKQCQGQSQSQEQAGVDRKRSTTSEASVGLRQTLASAQSSRLIEDTSGYSSCSPQRTPRAQSRHVTRDSQSQKTLSGPVTFVTTGAAVTSSSLSDAARDTCSQLNAVKS